MRPKYMMLAMMIARSDYLPDSIEKFRFSQIARFYCDCFVLNVNGLRKRNPSPPPSRG
jgi:hypothetical protein